MIEISWELIDLKPFRTAVAAVSNSRDIDAKQVYRAGRICQVAAKEADKIGKFKRATATKHGFSFLQKANGDIEGFSTVEQQEACENEIREAMEGTKVQIKVWPLDWKEIFGTVKMSGLEMVHLQEICENVTENQGEINVE